MSKQSSEMADQDLQRSSTTRGRKRKGEIVLWEFWKLRWFKSAPKWRRYRSYRTLDEAVRVKNKRERERWWASSYKFKITLHGEEPVDYYSEQWHQHREQGQQE